MTTEQVPVGVQQAPVGWGQGFGEQTVATPCQVFGETHAAWVVTVQTPDCVQQAPVGCGQGFGLHRPNIVQVPVQPEWLVTEQVPDGAQQAPAGCVQGLTTQAVPAPRQALGAAHAVCVVTVQTPDCVQQAPVG